MFILRDVKNNGLQYVLGSIKFGIYDELFKDKTDVDDLVREYTDFVSSIKEA